MLTNIQTALQKAPPTVALSVGPRQAVTTTHSAGSRGEAYEAEMGEVSVMSHVFTLPARIMVYHGGSG